MLFRSEAWAEGVALVNFLLPPVFLLYPAPSLPPSCCQRDRTFWHFSHQEKPRLNSLRDMIVERGWIAFNVNFRIKIKTKINDLFVPAALGFAALMD